MAPVTPKIIIAGAGIGGCAMSIMLERAGLTNYCILERGTTIRHVGGAIGISAQVFRVFEQMGILDDFLAVSKPLYTVGYYNQKKELLGKLDLSEFNTRYGFHNRLFGRHDLNMTLLKHVPKDKIIWGKKIQRTVQNDQGVEVICADGTNFHGDILIGADGAYSAVRQSMFKNMEKKGLKVSKNDQEPLCFSQFAVLGTTKYLGDKYPILNESFGSMEIICADRNCPYTVFAVTMPGGCLNWMVSCSSLPIDSVHEQDDFRFSDWDSSEAAKALRKELENLPIIIGGTVGNLLKETDHTQITRTLLEDKAFDVWHNGRTCLIGDAVHKTLPAGGQGANQCILDAVCLVNLFHEMPSFTQENITKAFTRYQEIRMPTAKQAVSNSSLVTEMIANRGLTGDMLRLFILSLTPSWVTSRVQDGLLSERPLLSFLPQLPDMGTSKDRSKPHTLNKGHAGSW